MERYLLDVSFFVVSKPNQGRCVSNLMVLFLLMSLPIARIVISDGQPFVPVPTCHYFGPMNGWTTVFSSMDVLMMLHGAHSDGFCSN